MFKVSDFTPTQVSSPQIQTAVAVGVATMDKKYEGEVIGRSTTLFTSAFNEPTAMGAYLAMESFDGTLCGRAGSFNFAHSKTTSGESPQDEFFVIVPGRGTSWQVSQ